MHDQCIRSILTEELRRKKKLSVRTNEVGDVVAVAEPSGGLAGSRQIDAVVGLVGPGNLLPWQVVVVAYVQRRVPEHVHRRHLPEPHRLRLTRHDILVSTIYTFQRAFPYFYIIICA